MSCVTIVLHSLKYLQMFILYPIANPTVIFTKIIVKVHLSITTRIDRIKGRQGNLDSTIDSYKCLNDHWRISIAWVLSLHLKTWKCLSLLSIKYICIITQKLLLFTYNPHLDPNTLSINLIFYYIYENWFHIILMFSNITYTHKG